MVPNDDDNRGSSSELTNEVVAVEHVRDPGQQAEGHHIAQTGCETS